MAVMIVVRLCQLSMTAMIFSGRVVEMDTSVMPMRVLEILKRLAREAADCESV